MRSWLLRSIVIGLLAMPGAAATAAGTDGMAAGEIEALQRRLTDAKCYAGPVDGAASTALDKAITMCPSQAPQLRIETGMHVATITRIGVDTACRLAATGSHDKTVRVWSLPEGRLLRTLRVPIGPGHNGGKVYATAMSPDGRWIAAGGWDARDELGGGDNGVYLFNVETGQIVARYGNFKTRITEAVFSPDGSRLFVGLKAGEGIRVLDRATGREILSDGNYTGDNYGATFGPDGRLYTVAWDGKLRRYEPGPAFAKEREVATRGGKEPYSVAIDSRGKLLVVGFYDTTRVDLYDAATLAFRTAADTRGIDKGDLGRVAWWSDGARLVAGGRVQGSGGKRLLVGFDRAGRRVGAPLPVAENTIMNIRPCDGGLAVAAYDPAFGLVDRDGRTTLWRHGVAPDMRGKRRDAFTVSADARQVRFGLGVGAAAPVRFDLSEATLAEAPAAVTGLTGPVTEGLPIADWQNTTAPTFAGKPIALEQYELARSLAVPPGRDGFVLGADYWLRAFDAEGKQRWQQAIPGVAWGVNLSADGRLVVAAYADGTIRWHRWSDGAELLALFVNRDTKAWVAWTPSGYYMASPGGEDMIGWHLNRGWDQAADFFPAEKFKDKFARPDIVERILDTLDEAEATRQADAARPRKQAAAPIIETLPPVLSILSPADGTKAAETTIAVDYIVRSPSGTPIEAVEALVDGKPLGARGLAPMAQEMKDCIDTTRGLGRAEGALQGCRGTLSVPLPPGTAEIGVFARAGAKTSALAKVRVTRLEAATPAESQKPRLYAVVVGVSDYANKDYRLAFAAKDARDFAAALKNQQGGIYGEVSVRLLADREATAGSIREALDWLLHQVTALDVGIVYFAGHGELDERGRFYLLAADSNAGHLRATAVPQEDVRDALSGLAGKALLFLDACHAGSLVTARRATFDFSKVVSDFRQSERGLAVFAASTGRQFSQESPNWGNGAFTLALVEGIGRAGSPGKADPEHRGTINPAQLQVYVARRVHDLTDGRQSPVMNNTGPEFPFALVR